MALASSVSSKDDIPSNSDSHWPSEPANATEKIGVGFSSTFNTGSGAMQSRGVFKSELVLLGKGNDNVLFSQGLSIGSKATEKVIFDGPETLKVTDTDISLQKEEKKNNIIEKHLDTESPTNCYKGCLVISLILTKI
jgi:hypothetical protein